ncbi:MAG: polysaccharide biosynthesis tyrosine autokinase [bacterium]|nr:polysaccharide biosynthesis tyrosine autokinase [bacterium]
MHSEIDLRKYVRVFLRQKWIFVGVFLGIIALTYLKTALTVKVYVGTTKVLIKRTSTLLGESQILEEAFGIDTNCEILRSRGFMEKVASAMRDQKLNFSFLQGSTAPDILLQRAIITPLRESDIIQIVVHSYTPQEVVNIANSIAETFKNYSVEIARAKITETRKFIEAEMPAAIEKLKDAEDSLRIFKENEKLVSISSGGSVLQEQALRLKDKNSELIAEIDTREKELEYTEEKLKEENDKLASYIVKVDNPSITSLRSQLVRLESEYSSYVLAGLEKGNPKLKALEKKLEELKSTLVSKVQTRSEEEILMVDPLLYPQELSKKILDIRSDIFILRAEKDALDERISKVGEDVKKFPSKEYEIAAFERIYKFNGAIYEKLVDRYEEAKLAEVGEIGNVIIVEYATLPVIPESPNPKLNMLLGLIFGFGLAIASVFVKEYLDPSIKEIEDVEKAKIPIIGAVPFSSNPIVKDSISPLAEAYNKLRVNLKFSKAGTKLRSVVISSCNAGEGKSTISSNIGIIYAKMDVKAIIIEADLRKPSLHKIFKIHSKIGLSNYLVGEVEEKEIIQSTHEENLSIIPAGHIPPNPGELIDSERMRTLVAGLKERYDIVIIDSPPLVSCADGFLLGTIADGVIVVIELGKTQRAALSQMVSSFRSTGASFLGVIPNRVRQSVYYRYPYYYKYYTAKS